MPDIKLPDGSIGVFPDTMSDTEIAAVLQKQFPHRPSRPTVLAPGERLLLDNAAEVHFIGDVKRYSVWDWAGRACGLRSSLEEAISLAESLPAEPPPRLPPSPAAAPATRDVAPREARPPWDRRPPRVVRR